MKLNQYELMLLDWLLAQAKNWRGSLVGNPDPQPLSHFDFRIKELEQLLARLRMESR